MPTLFDRLEAGLDTGALNSVLGEQVGQLGQVVSLVADLADHPPSSIGDFAAQLASLTAPGLPNGQSVTGSLTAASGALPTDFSAATGGAVAEIGRFTELVSTQLVPLLGNAVAVAEPSRLSAAQSFAVRPNPSRESRPLRRHHHPPAPRPGPTALLPQRSSRPRSPHS